jgi:hypothetical protein
MKIALAAIVTALLAAVVVVLMSTPQQRRRPGAHFADGPAAASSARPAAISLAGLTESEQLGEIDDHLAALQQQAADEAARRQWEAEQEAAQHLATLDALATLRHADAQLATGNWEGVDDELSLAEDVLSGRTRLDVEAAREALARSDLLPARGYLAAALSERRTPR